MDIKLTPKFNNLAALTERVAQGFHYFVMTKPVDGAHHFEIWQALKDPEKTESVFNPAQDTAFFKRAEHARDFLRTTHCASINYVLEIQANPPLATAQMNAYTIRPLWQACEPAPQRN
jgi:hypothetical protein